MKRCLTVLCLSASVALVACEKKEAPKKVETPKTGSAAGDALKGAADAMKDSANKAGETIKEQANKAGEAVDKVAKEAKDKAVSTVQGLYDSAKKEFDALSAKISASSSPEKPLWQKAADAIKSQFGDADKKMSDLKADNSNWQKISDELSALMTKIGDGVKSLAGQVK